MSYYHQKIKQPQIRMRSSKPLKKTIDTTLIHEPKTGVEYTLRNPDHNGYTTKVEFDGDLSDCYQFDVGSCTFMTYYNVRGYSLDPNTVFLTQESVDIPLGASPVYLTNNTGQVAAPSKIKISYFFGEINSILVELHESRPLMLTSDNARLRKEIKQELSTRINEEDVQVGNYPIQLNNKPSFAALKETFDQFIQYNTREMLAKQLKDTRGRCHIRAHFASILLKQHGISSCKIFKIWEHNDWIQYNAAQNKGTPTWVRYHTAALIVDHENNKWVWDPWENPHYPLAPLKTWLFQETEPTPYQIFISSMYVMNVNSKGHCAAATNFKTLNEKDTRFFQCVYGSASPNRPALNRFGIFAREIIHINGRTNKNLDLVRARDDTDDHDHHQPKRHRVDI